MVSRVNAVISIKDSNAQQPLTAAQKKFNQLSKKIAQQKKLLQQWQDTEQEFQQQVSSQLVPQYQQMAIHQIEMALLLDDALKRYKFGKVQQKKLIDVICDLCEQALDHGMLNEQQNNEVTALYRQHQPLPQQVDNTTQTSFSNKQNEDVVATQEKMRQELFEEFGVEVESYEIPVDDPEEFLNFLQEQLDAHFKQHHAQQQANKKPRKKTAKQLEKEQKEAQAEQLAKKSLKSIYQRLAAYLHPDRELDEQEKLRKTELMQQASHAYKQQDLIALLSMQFELQQLSSDAVQAMADEQLSLYNLNLDKTSKQLAEDIEQLTSQMAQKIQFPFHYILKPEDVLHAVKSDVKQQANHIQQIQRDLKLFADVANIKNFLRSYRL